MAEEYKLVVVVRTDLGLTKGNLSSRLAKLESAGYVEIEKTYKGKLPLTICHLTSEGRQAFDAYRQQIKDLVEKTGWP